MLDPVPRSHLAFQSEESRRVSDFFHNRLRGSGNAMASLSGRFRARSAQSGGIVGDNAPGQQQQQQLSTGTPNTVQNLGSTTRVIGIPMNPRLTQAVREWNSELNNRRDIIRDYTRGTAERVPDHISARYRDAYANNRMNWINEYTNDTNMRPDGVHRHLDQLNTDLQDLNNSDEAQRFFNAHGWR